MRRDRLDEGDSLWAELPAEPGAPTNARAADGGKPDAAAPDASAPDPFGIDIPAREPPDWALPAWDSLSPAPRRTRPRSSAAASTPPAPIPGPGSGDEPAPARAPAPPGGSVAAPDPPLAPPDVSVGPSLVPPPEAPRPLPAGSLEPSHSPVPAGFGLRILQVSDVTRAVRDSVRADDRLRDVWVEGEVGRVTVSSAGHAYFTLKDERSQLACVFFRDDRVGSPFEPRTGLRVVVHGRVDIFETQGVYQLYVAAVQPAGFGDLALRFEALKAKLAAEGLFDSGRKRSLPARPAVIGVATSASGAVWHDICQVLSRRWPLARVVISPCRVQGDGASASVVTALDRLAHFGERCRAEGRAEDAPAVVILARGGGSLEDLWPFNDERVVRAVVRHPVPVVSGVGHEVDVTLADFAADVRAPTPSAAAELVVPDRAEFAAALADLERRAHRVALGSVAAAGRELAGERRALERLRPAAQLAQARERAGLLLDRATRTLEARLAARREAAARLGVRLGPAAATRLALARAGVERNGAALAALGPQATLDRGYAIVRRRADAHIVRRPDEAGAGERLSIRLARGEIGATVDEPEPEAERRLEAERRFAADTQPGGEA